MASCWLLSLDFSVLELHWEFYPYLHSSLIKISSQVIWHRDWPSFSSSLVFLLLVWTSTGLSFLSFWCGLLLEFLSSPFGVTSTGLSFLSFWCGLLLDFLFSPFGVDFYWTFFPLLLEDELPPFKPYSFSNESSCEDTSCIWTFLHRTFPCCTWYVTNFRIDPDIAWASDPLSCPFHWVYFLSFGDFLHNFNFIIYK